MDTPTDRVILYARTRLTIHPGMPFVKIETIHLIDLRFCLCLCLLPKIILLRDYT